MKNGIRIGNINGAEVMKMLSNKTYEIKYNCVFSNSLLQDKCVENGLKISKQGTTKDIIKVGFDYGYTELDGDIEELITTNKWLKCNINKKNKTQFEYTIKLNKEKIHKLKNNPINYTKKSSLREIIYKNGFSINTYKTIKGKKVFDRKIKYIFFYRTGGQAKQGGDYFINEKILKKIDNWFKMGIKINKNEKYDLVGFEVYKSLVSSSIEDYYICKPNEILIVKDLDCYSDLQNVIRVQRNKNTGYSEAIHTKQRCKNTIWDGMALIQTENGSTGFRGLRHLFFKAGGFIADFQKYFKKYYGDKYETTTVKDIFGRDVLIKDVKMITTENAIKWVKYLGISKESFNHWSKYIEMNGCKFGICKRDHKSKYGSKQRMSYQMINTLPIDKKSIKFIFEDTLEFIKKLQNDNDFFIKHLNRTKNDVNNNELLIDLATNYPTFINSHYFKENRKQEIKKYKETLYHGKILNEGDNETVVGNPFLLLQYVTGQLDKYINDGIIKDVKDISLPNLNSCYCSRFNHGDKLGTFRSPHNSINNIGLFINDYSNEMEEYFYCFGENVIACNMLYNDVQDRHNGMDEDLDFTYTTNNKFMVDACEIAQLFPTIVNGFEKESKKYKYTMENLAIVDNNLQSSQKAIGTSSNLAQIYMTQYWNVINFINDRNCNADLNISLKQVANDMLDKVCILSVLAQVAVDSSKRKFIVGNGDDGLNSEISRLRKELLNKEKPLFWQYSSISYNKKEIEKRIKSSNKYEWNNINESERKMIIKKEKENMISKLVNYSCPMNWIIDEINKIGIAKRNTSISDDKFIIVHGNNKNRNKKKSKKIEEIINELNLECRSINIDLTIPKEEKDKLYYELYNKCCNKIKSINLELDVLSILIARCFSNNNKIKNNKQIKTKMLNILYKTNRDNFIKCFSDFY